MDFLPPLSAFTVFLGIAAVGFLFLIIALISGGLFDFFEFDHDFDHGGPGFFSSRVVAVFITAFGGPARLRRTTGFLRPPRRHRRGQRLFFGGLIFLFARFLYGQQASSDVRPAT